MHMVAEDIVPIMAVISVVDLAAFIIATESKRWLDTLDALFAYAFTFIAALITIMISAKYGASLYTWLGISVLVALMAYGALKKFD